MCLCVCVCLCVRLCVCVCGKRSYNPKEYAHLQVSQEVRDLFLYIQRYKPHEVELDTQLKCFIPDYLPAVGEMDSFLKVGRHTAARGDHTPRRGPLLGLPCPLSSPHPCCCCVCRSGV